MMGQSHFLNHVVSTIYNSEICNLSRVSRSSYWLHTFKLKAEPSINKKFMISITSSSNPFYLLTKFLFILFSSYFHFSSTLIYECWNNNNSNKNKTNPRAHIHTLLVFWLLTLIYQQPRKKKRNLERTITDYDDSIHPAINSSQSRETNTHIRI